MFFSIYLSDKRIVPAEMKTQQWLLPETTANFNELPLQYNGVCGYTLVNRDGLILPGTFLIIHQCHIMKGILMFLVFSNLGIWVKTLLDDPPYTLSEAY